MVRRIKRERSAAPTADVKREAGLPPAKKSKGKSDGKGGKNKRTRCTLDQDGAQLCGQPPVRNRQHLRGCPSNSRVQQLEKRRKEHRWQHGLPTLENPADPGVDPYPSAWLLPALASIILEPDAVQAFHRICCFGPPHWKEHCWVGFLPGLETFEKKCCCKVPQVLLSTKAVTRVAASYPPQLCAEKVLQSNASVCLQAKSKREDMEAENDLHVGGLRRPSQTWYLVPGWESTGRRLWDCIDTALSNDTDSTKLTRLYGQQISRVHRWSLSRRFEEQFEKCSL